MLTVPITLAERIDELVAQHGSLRAAAAVLRTDAAYLWRLKSGEKNDPGEQLLRRMKLRRVVSYERIGKAASGMNSVASVGAEGVAVTKAQHNRMMHASDGVAVNPGASGEGQKHDI
jgi:hypothetical protein